MFSLCKYSGCGDEGGSLVCFVVAFFLIVCGGVPGETLFVEFDDHLRAAHVGLSGGDQVGLISATPAGRRGEGGCIRCSTGGAVLTYIHGCVSDAA